MRLGEISHRDVDILRAAWEHLGRELVVPKGVNEDDAYEYASMLFTKAVSKGNFEDDLVAIREINHSTSPLVVRSSMAKLSWTGLTGIYPFSAYQDAALDNTAEGYQEVARLRKIVQPLLAAVTRMLAALLRMNRIVIGDAHDPTLSKHDALDVAICRAALKKLKLPTGPVIYN